MTQQADASSASASLHVLRMLVLIHVGLAAWALVGLAEFILPAVPWKPIANPLFSPAVLLAQWLLVLTTASIFVGGYLRRWRSTPRAIAIGYALMGGLCAYQTFLILLHDMRFVAMAAEFTAYVAIIAFLHLSTAARARFSAPIA